MLHMVEARRIELLSENRFTQLSTGVYYLLKFLSVTAGNQAGTESSPYTADRHGHA